MALTEQQLLKKKKEIETAKMELSELKGEEKALLKQLKENWQCATLIEAKKKLKEFEKEAEELTTKIEEATTELEETYLKEEV